MRYLFFFFLTCTCLISYSQVTVFSEGFENSGSMPANWSQEYVYDTLNWDFISGGQSGNPSTAYQGNYNARLYYGGIYRKTKLITPPLNLTYYSNVQLKFYHAQKEYSGDQDNLRVYYKTSLSGSWVLLASYLSNTPTWTLRTINLPNTNSATYYIGFEGDARYGYGVCIDKIEITGQVVSGLDIKLNAVDSPLIWRTGANNLRVAVKNVRSDTITNADFGYIIDGGTAVIDTHITFTSGLLPDQLSHYTFTTPVSLASGFHLLKTWVNKPNRTNPDDDPSNDTLSLSFRTGIQDTFYIDSSGNGDYTTFSQAIADLNYGVSGPTVFIVRKGTYTERIIIGEIPGTDSTNYVLFKGINKDSVTLTFQGLAANNRSTLVLKGADYVTFQDLTIQNTGTSYANCLLLKNSSNHNTFKNCRFKLNLNNNSGWAQNILASAKENTTATNGDNGSYNLFTNNEIIGGYYGVRFWGTNTAQMGTGNRFENNIFSGQRYYGLELRYQDGFQIEGNIISNFRSTTYSYGILIYYSTASRIVRNKIQPAYVGIYLYRENNYHTSNTTLIANNMISNFTYTSAQIGIYGYYYCYGLKILHNTIWVNGNLGTYSYGAIKLWYYPRYTEIKNNLIVSTGNTLLLSLYYPVDVTIDQNDYFYDTNSSSMFYNNAYYANFSTFRNTTAYLITPHDANSYDNIDPGLISKSDVHLDTLNSISLMATHVGITTDFDNAARDTTFGVNLGADEIRHPDTDLDIINLKSPKVMVAGNNPVTITLRNMGTDSLIPQKVYLSYSFNLGNWVNDSLILTTKVPPFDTVNFTFGTSIQVSGSGTYTLCTRIYPQIVNDPDANDSFCVSKCVGLSGNFVIDHTGKGDYISFSEAVNAINNCGVSGPVKFIVKAGNYFERVEIAEIPGASATNTITFEGVSKDSVTIIYAGSSVNRATFVLDGADHIIVKNISIKGLGSYYAIGVHLRSHADSNTISNCKITVPASSSSLFIPVMASSSEASYYSYGNNANANLFENNIISGGYFGIKMNGSDKNNLCFNNRFIGNTIKNFYYYGIYMIYQGGAVEQRNKILNPSVYYGFGIYHYYCQASVVDGNRIYPGRYGIYLYYENYTTPQASTDIFNNMISNFSDNAYQLGIYGYIYCYHLNILHNSIKLTGSYASAYYSGIRLYYHCDSAVIKNNIISSENSSFLLSLYLSTGTEIDYNDYYYPNSTYYKFYNSAYYNDLTAFKNSSYYLKLPHDSHSFDNIYPGFVSSTDLHISDSVGGLGGDTVYVYEDADGDPRCISFPTLGADEKGPVADFSINDTNQCFNNHSFVFTNNSVIGNGTLISYLWKFGDGDTSSDTSTFHAYTSAGTYTVTLIAYPQFGCPDSISKQITVFPSPITNFSINDSDQCLSQNNFSFTNLSSVLNDTLHYIWNFGDGYQSVNIHAQHNYLAHDTFEVSLISISSHSCNDTTTKNIIVFPNPDADFTYNSSSQCIDNNNFQLTNLSSIPSGILAYNWSFGDSDTSILLNPTHQYNTTGSFSIKLITTSSHQCLDSITKTVSVHPMPLADFNINDSSQCFNNNIFQFSNNSGISTGFLSFAWDFGDQHSATGINASHAYSSADTFGVKLTATSSFGCQDSLVKNIIVFPQPQADFSMADTGLCQYHSTVILTNHTTIQWGNATYLWSYGDGQQSSLTHPVHTYLTPGHYVIKLRATSDQSCEDSISKTAHVYPAPVVLFSVNDTLQCITGNSFAFSNQSHADTGSLSYLWSFGDGNTSTLKNPVHSYLTYGTYSVKLRVSSSFGCSDSIEKTIYVTGQPGTGFTINDSTQCFNNNTFTFTNTTSLSSSSPIFYQWNFGDNQNSALSSPTHSYNAPGSYWVKLVALAGQCSDSTSKQIQIYPSPVVAFSINDTQQCLNSNSFSFSNSTTLSSGSVSYLWNFGDNQTSTAASTSHSYSTADTFLISLVAVSNYQCSDTSSATVKTIENPVASFNVSDTIQCFSGNNFVSSNLSTFPTGSTPSWFWSTGDGFSYTNQNISHGYASSGNYIIKLVVNSGYCTDSLSKAMQVNPTPQASFTIADSIQCLSNNQFTFTNNSGISSGTLSFLWDFGDKTSSSSFSPAHSYTKSDTFNIRLTVISDKNCSDSASLHAFVLPGPVVDFSVTDSIQCFAGNNFLFNNNSSYGSSSYSLLWDFDDGLRSTQVSPSHSYLSAGTYQAKLRISNPGCSDSLSKTIIVHASPSANFTINDSTACFDQNNFILTNYSTLSSGALSYSWDFGDLSSSTQKNVNHTYNSADTFHLKLLVSSAYGCKDSLSKTLYVFPSPNAAFSINDSVQCLSGNSYVLTNVSSVQSGNLTYAWSFGNGQASNTTQPVISYASADTFTISLVATTSHNCMDSVYHQAITLASPQADFTINDTGQCLPGNSFVFSNNSSVTGSNANYVWDFGDGQTSTSESPTHSFSTYGVYEVKLVVAPDSLCFDSMSKTARVFPDPTAAFTVNDTGQCKGSNSFLFTNQSTVGSGNLSYIWTFGDGNSSTATDASHSYASDGNYQVSLVSSTTYGCADTSGVSVHIYASPNAAFSVLNSSQCLSGNQLSFFNQSSLSPGTLSYLWQFGDGNSSTQTNPVHHYNSADTFLVTLYAISNQNCFDSSYNQVVIHPKPLPDFTVNDSTQCVNGNSFSFTNASSSNSGFQLTLWNFGDGNLSLSSNPVHSYTQAGNYDVSLYITSGLGCKDTLTKQVVVMTTPLASFTVNNYSQCLNTNLFQFTNQSTSPVSFSSWWDFGDTAAGSTLVNPVHSYSSEDTFTVKLVITDSNQCSDSSLLNVKVLPVPHALFTLSDSSQCLHNNLFGFTNASFVNAGQSMSYYWNFGDGYDTSSPNLLIQYSYTTDSNFNVQLVAVSNYGCADTFSKTAYVRPEPEVLFTVNDTQQCFAKNNFNFSNITSLKYGSYQSYWQFGDGDTSTLDNPSHTYSFVAGNAYVKLLVTTDFGCSDSFTQQVHLLPSPYVDFGINDTTQCLNGNNFIFDNYSSIPSGYLVTKWYFGDGITSYKVNPQHTYHASHSFVVGLAVSSWEGCKDSIAKIITVYPKPYPDFTLNDSTQCLNTNNFSFQNNTFIQMGNLQHHWYFGNMDSSHQKSPVYTYSTSGKFDVKLVSVSDHNCRDSLIKGVEVFPVPNTKFSVSANKQCLVNNLFEFINKTSLNNNTIFYTWNFDDDSISTLESPDYHYSSEGKYTVWLLSRSIHNCKDSAQMEVEIYPQPHASLFVNDSIQCFAGNKFSFLNTSGISKGSLYFTWLFGDSLASSLRDPVHSYAIPGLYPLKLKIHSENNCYDSAMANMNVLSPPYINLGKDTAINDRQTLLLNAGNGFSTYYWNDSSQKSTLLVEGSKTGMGTFTYFVIVEDSFSCTNSDTIVIVVKDHTGIEPESFASLKIYPNPARDILYIQTEKLISPLEISMFSSGGKRVLNKTIPESSPTLHSVDISRLSKGIYYLRIQGTDFIKVEKIMINNR